MTTTPPPAPRRTGPPGGPPPLAPALAYAVLAVVAVALSATLPHPSASAASVLAYDRTHHTALQVAGFLNFGASLPLAIWTATAYRRLRTLGVTAPGAVIGLAGGLLATASLALSGLVTWTAAQIDAAGTTADPALAHALADLAFATGGPGFVVPFALLLAGIAVPSLLLRFVPKALAWTGLVIAGVGVLSTLTLLTSALDVTLPIGRFGGLLWLIATSVALPRTRHEVGRNVASVRADQAPAVTS